MGLPSFLGDPFVGAAANHRRDVARADETVEPHVRRIENGADGWNDGDVVAEDGEIVQPSAFARMQRECGGGRGGFKADGEEHHVLFRIVARSFRASEGE